MTQATAHTVSGPLDPRLRRTRWALTEALLVLLGAKAFEDISIREITTKAKVGYATFYRHYASKLELLHELADRKLGKLVEVALPVVASASTREACRTLCILVDEHRGLWRAVLSGAASGVVREEVVRKLQRLKGSCTASSAVVPEELRLICMTGVTLDVLTWWLSQRPTLSVERVADILDELITAVAPRNPSLAQPALASQLFAS